jgi:SAM-dependent methyltransferase
LAGAGNISADWYRRHAERYAQVADEWSQSIWVTHSHPALTDEQAALDRLVALAPGRCGLDVGCGAGARDVYRLMLAGYDVTGIDTIEENVALARTRHPEIAARVSVHDIREPLPFADASFDFAFCNSVIQHLEPEALYGVTLPEFARVLRPDGALQLIFKCGSGVLTIEDPDYGAERSFRLYEPDEVIARLAELGLALVRPRTAGEMGGVLHCEDHRRIDTCVMWVQQGAAASR